MLISLLVGPSSRILVVMWVEANFPSIQCDWVVGVTIVFIVLIVLMSLMSLILAFSYNSSLAPVLRFRRRFVSVCNVLKEIKEHGFSEARIAALWYRWHAVVRMDLLALSPRLSLGPIGSLLTFMGFINGLWILWPYSTSSPSNFSVAGLVQLDSGRSYLPSVSMASSGVCPSGSLSGLQAS